MKILLIQPYTFTIRGLPQIPLALMYVGGCAEKQGHVVKILDRNIETNSRKIINNFKPEIIGVTSLTGEMLLDGIKISKYIRYRFPKAKIVWGGIHASILPENTIKEEFIDYIVIGEGEITFVKLLEAIENNKSIVNIKGIGYKKGDKIIINERRELIKNLDTISLIPWHLINPKKYLRYETLFITSRGCPHRCTFCYNEKFNFRSWRGMSPNRVKTEIENAKQYHPIRRFRFDDDNFCVDKKRFHQILNFLPKDIPLYFECRINYIDEKFCQHIAEFKDAFIFIGVESGDDEMLKKMQKDITVEQIKHGYSLINKYKINTSASFIIGYPEETHRQLQKTLTLINNIKPTRPSCCIFVPFPGSKITEKLIQEKKLHNFKTLKDWGRFTNSEVAKAHNFSQISNSELNKIYSLYWKKFIWGFILKLRFNWVFAGAINVLKNYYRLSFRRINKDI